MENKIYRQVLVDDRFPKRSGDYHTDYGIAYFRHPKKKFYQEITGDGGGTFYIIIAPEYFLEEIDLPSKENIGYESLLSEQGHHASFINGANYILNKLKGGN